MKITIRVYDPCISVLVLFVLLTENFMYLIDTEKVNIAGVLNYNDMWAYLLALYELYYILKIKMHNKYGFKFGVGLILISCIVSAFQGSYIYGQPLMMGIRPQRFYIVGITLYFLVRKQLATKKMTAINLLDLLVTMGAFEGFLCTIQFILSGHVTFMHASSNMRYGSVRIYFDSGLMIFTTIASWCFYLRKGERRYLFYLIFGLIYEFAISKGRLENVCVVCSLFISFIMLRKNVFKKVMVLFVIITSLICVMNTSYSKVLLTTIKSTFDSNAAATEDTGEGDTMAIRKEGRQHYKDQESKDIKNLILGCGYPNTLFEKAVEYACADTYALVDNGIFSYIFIYGFLGTGVVAMIAIKSTFLSLRLYIKKGALFPLAYIVVLVPLSYNIIFWWWKPDSTLLLSIYLAVVDHYYNDKCGDNEFVL